MKRIDAALQHHHGADRGDQRIDLEFGDHQAVEQADRAGEGERGEDAERQAVRCR